MQAIINDIIELPAKPAINGLVLRHFRGTSDFDKMVAVVQASKEVDGLEWTISAADTERDYAHLRNCDPAQDMIFAEIDGEVVGYGRCWWDLQLDGTYIYLLFAHLKPAWRNLGIRRTMVHWCENRLKEIASDHPEESPKYLQLWISKTERHWAALAQAEGYQPIRYSFSMERPNLEDIPDHPLPSGLEVRQADMAQWPAIFAAAAEAFRDHWGAEEWTEQDKLGWEKHPTFDPSLWEVAWDGDDIAGGVLTFIDKAENEEYGRLRGYTETIFTRRPWRRQGLARALIARSLRRQKALGMTDSALGVDAENVTGALQLYRSMGFVVSKHHALYRKLLCEELGF